MSEPIVWIPLHAPWWARVIAAVRNRLTRRRSPHGWVEVGFVNEADDHDDLDDLIAEEEADAARRAVESDESPIIVEVVPDPDDAAYIASGRPFRVLAEEWTWGDGAQVRTIRKIERVDE